MRGIFGIIFQLNFTSKTLDGLFATPPGIVYNEMASNNHVDTMLNALVRSSLNKEQT